MPVKFALLASVIVVGNVAFWTVVIYIALHFIGKLW